mmetsp:Transcript_55274/g.63207  ORF Transcript_55274/g.63207 Transcript_55274/m.63207 type:complete len:222 (+) Transcript_55274:22-687(+)
MANRVREVEKSITRASVLAKNLDADIKRLETLDGEQASSLEYSIKTGYKQLSQNLAEINKSIGQYDKNPQKYGIEKEEVENLRSQAAEVQEVYQNNIREEAEKIMEQNKSREILLQKRQSENVENREDYEKARNERLDEVFNSMNAVKHTGNRIGDTLDQHNRLLKGLDAETGQTHQGILNSQNKFGEMLQGTSNLFLYVCLVLGIGIFAVLWFFVKKDDE